METEVGTATVSVLFCDVVGSTELLSHLGDDANDDVRRACTSPCGRRCGPTGARRSRT